VFRFKWSSRVNLARININHVHHDLRLLFSISAVLQQPHVHRKGNEKIKFLSICIPYIVSIKLFSIYMYKHTYTYLYTYMYMYIMYFAHEWVISSNLSQSSCCHKHIKSHKDAIDRWTFRSIRDYSFCLFQYSFLFRAPSHNWTFKHITHRFAEPISLDKNLWCLSYRFKWRKWNPNERKISKKNIRLE